MFHRGDVVRALRERQGWNQTELARKADVDRQTVVRAEQNKPNVTEEIWRKLALALNVPPEWLIAAHADPMSGSSAPVVTHPVTGSLKAEGFAPTPSPGSPMSPHAAAKARLLHLIAALDDTVAAQLEGQIWRLVVRAQSKSEPQEK